MEINNIRIDEFPLLFGSYGICGNVNEQFTKILNQLGLFNKEAIELQTKLADIINKVKGWLEKDLSADAVDYYSRGINLLYPTKTPPEDQAFDITYQERYSIGQQFISERKKCNEKMQKCLEMCDDPEKLLKDSIVEICNVVNLVRNQFFKFNSFVEKTLNDSTNLNQNLQVQLVSLINNIDNKIEKCQNDITSSKEKIDLCQELLDSIELQFNRVRLGRTSAYSDQIQNCTICGKQYIYLKWCKSCDRDQFKNNLSEWTSGNAAIDKFIRYVQLNINHPNCVVEWIPYDQFTNITYIGNGGFATVYRAT
ncbi:kinase-like protein [Gigaspora margarita]|uniref:Kinase-like protein n=1 Tax=Gigaspora margarita TaxID=4874 RepID=A0A8H4EQF6_GIGMA|nr:kinase-like protein [Gigaspora margarita]